VKILALHRLTRGQQRATFSLAYGSLKYSRLLMKYLAILLSDSCDKYCTLHEYFKSVPVQQAATADTLPAVISLLTHQYRHHVSYGNSAWTTGNSIVFGQATIVCSFM